MSATQVPHHIRRRSPSSSASRRARCAWSRPTSAAASATRASTIPRRRSSSGRRGGSRRPVRWIATRSGKLPLRQPGARSRHPRRACARRRRPFPRAARRDHRQPRRLCLDLRRRHSERDLQRAVRRRLSHAGDLRRGDRRVHQHARRPTPIAAPAGPRPATCSSGSPTARRAKLGLDRAEIRRRNLIPPTRHAVQDADRADLRLRRFPEDVRARAGDRRLRRLRQAPRRGRPPRQAARHRHGLLCRILGRRAVALRRHARRARRLLRGGIASASSPTARCAPRSAPTITARATPPPLRRSSRRGSACRSRRSRSSRATPTRCRTAPAPSARARSRSAARRSTAPPSKIVAKGKLIAAHLLEAARRRHRFRRRRVHGRRHRPARRVRRRSRRPPTCPQPIRSSVEPGLQDTAVYDPPNFAFSNGAHVCEVEIDPETGEIDLVGSGRSTTSAP